MSKPQKKKVIIIGGGIAGLMCASILKDAGFKNFLVITKDVGGRILSSQNKIVNYGAYFVTKRYKTLWPFLDITRRMPKRTFGFVKNGWVHSLFEISSIKSFFRIIGVFWAIFWFERRFNRFRRACLSTSQKEALLSDPYLLKLYEHNGSVVVHDLHAYKLVRAYFDQLGNFMSFAYLGHANGFSLLQWASEMLLHRMYEFELNVERLIHGYKKKIIPGEVMDIKIPTKEGFPYVIVTDNGTYEADYVVLATEPWTTRKLLGLHSKKQNVIGSYVRHIAGTPKGIAVTRKRYLMFPSRGGMISIGKQSDGTYLVYTDSKDVDISPYFETFEIIYEREWTPAFIFSSHRLLEAHHHDRLWIAGGSNFEGMEDCAITGKYAANQILSSID